LLVDDDRDGTEALRAFLTHITAFLTTGTRRIDGESS
jgi:hypothetical protein